MNILGFNCYGHDSAAAIIIDDKIVFAVEEERLTRKKHYGGIPIESIKECLRYTNLKLSDIDHITFFWKPIISYSKVPIFLFKYIDKIPSLMREQKDFTVEENLGMLNYLGKMNKLPKTLRELFPEEKNLKFKFHLLEHHFTHAASALFCSPFEEAAILTIDGAGEWTTSQLSHGKGIDIKKISTVDTPYSIGAFYQAVSRHLGFKLIEGPGKLMGLSSFGNKNSEEYNQMKKLITLTNDGGFKLDMSYMSYHYTRKSGVSPKFINLFGESKTEGKNWTEHEMNVAAAAQHLVEDVIIHMANHLHKVTKSDNLCMAGGVALNSVTNGLLLTHTPFKNFFIQPAAGDSGTAPGSALYYNHCILKRKRNYVMHDAFLGPEYGASEYEKAINEFDLPYIKTNNYNEIAAKMLAKGKIVAWFQGRMEFGPRALGNRSILANPCIAEMKDILNARVKFREGFRPFAAIILEEHCGTYFDNDYPNPYMLMVYNVLENMKSVIPAITHVDGTVRIQTVNKTENPPMRELLTAFQKETGVPVLINTSFNIKGEPIVCTPHDAVSSFHRADMDYLVIGDYVVAKKGDDSLSAYQN